MEFLHIVWHLEVDRSVTLPSRPAHQGFLITGQDVLHSWSLPSLPSRMPRRSLEQGDHVAPAGGCVLFGQCSGFSGVSHWYTPIVFEAVSLETYAAHARKIRSLARVRQ